MKTAKDYLCSWEFKENLLTKKLKGMGCEHDIVVYLAKCLFTDDCPKERPYALGIMARYYQKRFITSDHLESMTINDLKEVSQVILGKRIRG